MQCEIGTISNGTWTLADTDGDCATNFTNPGDDAYVGTVSLIQPSPGEKVYAKNSSQC
jgi:hypothetical protein